MSEKKITFWEDRWQAALAASPLCRRRNPQGGDMLRWNKMAAGFAKRTADKASEENRQHIIQWLKDLGALAPGARVLDIGAGPGHWSVLLARTAAHVVALEPAGAMADILEKKIDEAGIANISIDRRTWQAVDLAADNWQGAFDLVFASMTPGIDGPAALRKMMAAAGGYCYFSAFSGRGWQQWYGDLWQAVFNETLNGHPGDIIHPFNLIYAMGHRPDLRFAFRERETRLSRDEAMEDFCIHVEGFAELTPEIRAKIAAYVDEHCDNGFLTLRRGSCKGMMVWDVNQRVSEK